MPPRPIMPTLKPLPILLFPRGVFNYLSVGMLKRGSQEAICRYSRHSLPLFFRNLPFLFIGLQNYTSRQLLVYFIFVTYLILIYTGAASATKRTVFVTFQVSLF